MKKLLLILLCLPFIGFGQDAEKKEMNDKNIYTIKGVNSTNITKEDLIAANEITLSQNDNFEIISYEVFAIDDNKKSETILVDYTEGKDFLKNKWGEDSLDIDGNSITRDGEKVKIENRVKGKFTSEVIDLIKRSNLGSSICFSNILIIQKPFEPNPLPSSLGGTLCVILKQ